MLKVPEELLDLRDQHGIFKDQKKNLEILSTFNKNVTLRGYLANFGHKPKFESQP